MWSYIRSKKEMQLTTKLKEQFEPELIREMEQSGKVLSLPSGTIILETGQTVRQVPLVLKGSVKVSRIDEEGNELLLYYINPAESCAMTFTCCMQQYPSEINAVVEEDATILVIPIALMDEWMMKYTTWKSFVMTTIRMRFNELLKSIDQIAFMKLDERLITYLKDKSKTTGSTIINVSHQQIATELATSRTVISRLLKKLENDQRILLYRNQIKIMKAL